MLLLADIDEGNGLAAEGFLCGLSVGGGFLLQFDMFPEEIIGGPGFVVAEGIQAPFFEFTDEFAGQYAFHDGLHVDIAVITCIRIAKRASKPRMWYMGQCGTEEAQRRAERLM